MIFVPVDRPRTGHLGDVLRACSLLAVDGLRTVAAGVHLAGVHPVPLLQQFLLALLPLQRMLHQLPAGARASRLPSSPTLRQVLVTSSAADRSLDILGENCSFADSSQYFTVAIRVRRMYRRLMTAFV